MADISKNLKAIKNAKYGEEVRGSIHDALIAMNEGLIGIKTPEGGEIFNDCENNKAISEHSHASGQNTFAGSRGFYFYHMEINDDKTYQLYLSDVPNSVPTSACDVSSISVGDILSINNNFKYDECCSVLYVYAKQSMIIVDKLPFTQFVEGVEWSLVDVTNPEAGTVDLGRNSHAEGQGTVALRRASHAEGADTKAIGMYSHTEGRETKAYYGAHAEGRNTKALGEHSHSEGFGTQAIGNESHAEGSESIAQGIYSHAEGQKTQALSNSAHSEGKLTIAGEAFAHAEGEETEAHGRAAHTEGIKTTAEGRASHAEGENTTAKGICSHAEGYVEEAKKDELGAIGGYSHTEGYNTTAIESCCHAEGNTTVASGYNAHAEGTRSKATSHSTHAEGIDTLASGRFSHTEGQGTVANGEHSHVQGKFNIEDNENKYADIVGNGTSDSNRSNAYTLDWEGNAWYASSVDAPIIYTNQVVLLSEGNKKFALKVGDDGTLYTEEVGK